MVAAVRMAKTWWRKHPLAGFALVAVLVIAGVTGAYVLSAQALPMTFAPTGTVTSEWPTIVGGTLAHEAVDEAASDGDTSYVACNADNQQVEFSFADTTIPGTIDAVTAYAYIRLQAADNDEFRWLYYNGSVSGAGAWTVPGTTYAQYSYTVPAPAGGWTQAAFDALTVGLDCNRASNPMTPIRVTQVFVVVDYTTDTTAPTVDTASPTTDAVLTGASTTISGTAVDASGISSVEVQIQRSDGQYWNGTGWTGTATWNAATGTTSWNYSWSLDSGQDKDYTYSITSRATDTFSNVGTDATPVTGVTVDNEGPAIDTSAPANDAVLTGASTTISGTASDASGVASVDVQIQRSDSQYWNGTGWTGTATWNAATGTTSWTYNWSLDPGQDKIYTYSITSRATDSSAAANTGTDASPVTGVTVDNSGPVVNTSDPLSDAVLSGASKTVSGTSSDGSGVASVDVKVQRSDGQYWDGSGWTGTETWNAASGTANWTYVWSLDADQDGTYTYTITSRATDAVGNVGTDATPTTGVKVDNKAPVVDTAAPASSAVLTASTTTISGTASDGSGIASVDVKIERSDGQYWNAGAWTSTETWNAATGTTDWTYEWSLDASQDRDYTYSITSRAVDTLGNAGADASAVTGVTVDNEGPVVDTTAPANSAVLTGSTTTISGTAADSSDIASADVRIERSDGQFWNAGVWTSTETWNAAAGTTSWTYEWALDAGQDGTYTYTITSRAADTLGNVAADPSAVTGVTVNNLAPDTDPPTVDATDPLNDAVLTGSSKTISGAASDGDSGVASVDVSIRRSDAQYWTGSGWSGTETWNAASGTTSWTYAWSLDPGQDGSYIYTITARATDNASNVGTDASPVTGVTVDNAAAEDTEAPTAPTNVVATGGLASPTIAALDWTASTDNVGVTGYRVYRSASESGTYLEIGTSDTTSFSDVTGVAGQDYWYKVAAYDAAGNESAATAATGTPVCATWTLAPHAVYNSATQLCKICHAPHLAATTQNILRDTGAGNSEVAVCYVCHDGSGALSNIKTGADNSFALTSGHRVEDLETATDLTDSCADCHNPHVAPAAGEPLPARIVNGVEVTASDNSWCLACHNATNDWYEDTTPAKTYPTIPSRDTTGFPAVGTFPGPTVYGDSGHNLIPASAPIYRETGDCLYCHASHQTAEGYDALLAPFGVPEVTDNTLATYDDYAALCFQCHGTEPGGQLAQPVAGAVDIQQFVTAQNERSGHRINTAGGELDVGAPLPCYDCHNPHGSGAANGLAVTTSIGGTEYLLGDGAGEIDMSTTAGVRLFCFTCHTGDTSSGDSTIQGTDTSGTGFVTIVAATDYIEGIDRTAYNAGAKTGLHLPAIDGHYTTLGTQPSCYQCHGSDYSGVSGFNVHKPSPGESTGGTDCFACHSYQSMQSNAGYHHYMTSDSAAAYPSIADPTTLTTTDARRTCLTCHVDHDYFIPANADAAHTEGRAQNFRSSVAVAPDKTIASTYVNYDYSDADTGDGGVCTSCHKVQMTENTANRNNADTRSSSTVPVSDAIFGLSAHNYMATAPDYTTYSEAATFSSDTDATDGFAVNCGKCHNDTLTKAFQDGTYKFGLHDSDSNMLQTDNGQPEVVSDPQEQLCWLCHSRSDEAAPNNPQGGTLYAGDEPDMYGGGMAGGVMQSDALNTKGMFTNAAITSAHPVDGDGTTTARVECANCHNPHKAEYDLGFAGASGVVQDPDNTLVGSSLGGTEVWYAGPAGSAELQANAAFCLTCHDGAAPAYVNDGTSYVPYDVYIPAADASAMNKSTNGARGHWSITGAIAAGEEVPCASCHDKHGSKLPKLLGLAISPTADPAVGGSTLTGNNNTVCAGCHASATGTSYTRLANGYPNVGTWPGTAVYDGATGIHNATVSAGDVIWPSTTYGDGDCKNCHNVHGTAYAYDETVAQFGPSAGDDNYALCFTCHDGSPSTRNIKQYFPVADGGTATQTASTNYGHKIQTAGGTIAVGEGLPCYDCHAVHGSATADGLQVETSVGGTKYLLGDAAGEIDMSSAAGVRQFCFTCHTGDTSSGDSTIQGTSSTGSGYTAIAAATDYVEGIDRTAFDAGAKTGLHLPAINGHYTSVATQSCYDCHGNSYADATSNNVHNPGPGASQGGQDCYICHDYQSPMEDDLGTKTGATNADAYHHVLGSATNEGDRAFAAGSYPISTTDVYCLSCHVDHDKFNANKDGNLRPDIATTNPTGASTDYDSTANSGVCTSCHAGSLTKQGMGTEQKDDGSTATPKIVAGGGANQFGASAHDYYATSTFGAGNTFNANCSKCHNDEQPKSFQDSTYTFGTHWSSYQRILSALGGGGGGTGSSSTTLYASGYTETSGTWTTPGNSVNAPDGSNAVSSDSVFELRQSFTMPSGMTNISAASVQVRSMANGGWGVPIAGTPGQQQRFPTSDLSTTGWATAPLWSKVAESPHDSATTQISNTTANNIAGFGHSAFSIPADASNISVSVYYVCQKLAAQGNNLIEQLRVGSTYYPGDSTGMVSGTWTQYGYTWATNPGNGNAAWTVADINGTSGTALSGFGLSSTDVAPVPYVTQAYVQVDYTSGGGTRDDTWQIDYSLDGGTSWLPITAASTTDEAALADHPATALDLTGILTPANASSFRVRVQGTQVNALDPAGPVMNLDGTTLSLTYDYSTTGGLLAEKHCYRCHSRTTDDIGGTAKSTALRDYYDATAMTAASERVYAQFQLGSRHPVASADQAGGDVVECESCHNAHVVTTTAGTGRTTDPDNTYNTIAFNSDATQSAFCLKCHDGSLPAYTVNSTTYIPYTVTQADTALNNKATNAARGHWSTTGSISAGEQVTCAECHDNHGSTAPKLLGAYDMTDSRNEINGAAITLNNSSVCVACHTAASGGYPTYTRLANGYPDTGTYPGYTVYNGANGIHKGATVIYPGYGYLGGDCKHCHNVHGTASPYDETVAQFGPSAGDDDYKLCFDCHDGSPSATNIKQFFPTIDGGTATGGNFGHQIKTAGGTLTQGQGTPCYDCHDPHGSASADGLLVHSQDNGVTSVVGDAAGEIDMSTAAGIRLFCFNCHVDASDQGTNATGSAYTTINGTALVEGLSRIAGTNKLKLSTYAAHQVGNGQSCYDCHGNDYSTAASINVHNPGPGMSTGGADCYGCHPYQSAMEDDTGAKTGATNAASYHHVLGSATNDGDRAFAAGSYPASTTDVYCLSCHVDHDKFNAPTGNKANNLRPDIATTDPTGVATDFSTTTNAGVCTKCHAGSLAKQGIGTEQKDDGSTATPKVLEGAAANQFGASAHNYYASSTFGTGNTFNANCSKCHNDEQSKSFQDSTAKFGTHWSTYRRVLSALGAASPTDPLQETHCYGCHTGATGTDYYGGKAMSAASQRVRVQFQLAYKHPVVAAGGGSVECESCHNAHVVTTTTGKVTDPDNTYNTVPYATDANQAAFCLKCHDGNLPAYTVNATTYIPYTVTQGGSLNNKSTNAARGHWSITGAIGSGEEVSCAECHDNHGSSAPKLLGAYDMTDSRNEINGTAITANNNTVCSACHASATGTSYTRLANGYPNIGTWPGTTVYNNATLGIHNATASAGNVIWPGSSYLDGECNNCHNVHGTAYAYDETVAQFGPSGANDNYALCFTCHDGSPSTRNIKQYFPVADGGTATQTAASNYGHKIQTAGGTIAVGEGLPCYDCHAVHGSAVADGLQVETSIGGTKYILGDAAGEIDMSTTAGNRLFCFTCHTGDTSSANTTVQGTNSAGTGFVNIADNTDYIEGIDRYDIDTTNKTGLHLPAINGHYTTIGAQGPCTSCHGNAYVDANSNNVHNPGPGGSTGGQACYQAGCHDALQPYMEDGAGTKTGSSRGTVFHHVLGNGTTEGDNPFAAGSYPPAGTNVYCLSCHVDHVFTSGSSLRADVDNAAKVASSTDFVNSGTYGVCLGCHDTQMSKDNTNQATGANGTSSRTIAISGANYATSKHNYTVTQSGSTFQGNCTKCHNDGSLTRLSIHYSAEARLAKALNVTLTGTNYSEENLCFKCHTGGTAGTDGYGVAAMDAPSRSIQNEFGETYKHNVAGYAGIHKADESLDAPAQVTPATGTGWLGTSNSNKHIECEDCHNVHEAQAGTYYFPDDNTENGRATGNTAVVISNANKGVWGVNVNGATSGNWAGTGTFGTPTNPTYDKVAASAYEWQMCLKCHSIYAWGTQTRPTVMSLKNTTSSMTDVGLDFSPKQQAIHPLFAQGKNQPPTNALAAWDTGAERRSIGGVTTGHGLSNTFVDGWLTTSRVTCSDCHGNDSWTNMASGPHGSGYRWILRGYNTGTKVTTAAGVINLTTAAAQSFCNNCHRVDVYSDANGGNIDSKNGNLYSRTRHSGDVNSSCIDSTRYTTATTGCQGCHGGRVNDNALPNGAIHGTSMGAGDGDNTGTNYLVQNGTLVGDPMGYRFTNGAAWDAHLLGDASGNYGCSTLNTADGYSDCTQHTGVWAKSPTPLYYYARPTN